MEDDDDIGDMHLEETREERPGMRSSMIGLPRKVRVSESISTEFLVIVEQMLAQHVAEIAEMKAEIDELRDQGSGSPVSDGSPVSVSFTGLAKLAQQEEEEEEDEEPLKESKNSSKRSSKNGESKLTSRKSSKERGGPGQVLSIEKILRKKNESMPSLHAGQIMNILEENAEELDEVFQEKPRIDSEALPGLLSDTASVLAERYHSLTFFEKTQYWLRSHQYEVVIFVMLYLNVLWMALDLHTSGLFSLQILPGQTANFKQQDMDAWYDVFKTGDVIFAAIFMCDVVLRVCVLQCSFWKVWLNYVDVVVSVLALVEATIINTATSPVNPMIFRFLRIGKLVRAVRMVTMTSAMSSLQLLVKCLASSRDMLFCSFSILTFVQCVAGVILATLCADFIRDETQDANLRVEVFKYYGTFSRTFLTMFEIMFANWGPPCRVLVENVSEWFSVFFLIYRCVLGFAVLNVMNAVFVQQTMRTAVMDEDLAFKQRQKEIDQYIKKVKTLFQGLDSTGDGAINLEEFSKLVKSEKLAFWMSQLELEYHDLLQLFEFLDNGDGHITLTEFIDGAARLRGGAKAIDVWRMETKLEVLFEEVLTALTESNRNRRSTVKDVLSKSSFQFINSNAEHNVRAMDSKSNAARGSLVCDEIDAEELGSARQSLSKSRYSVV